MTDSGKHPSLQSAPTGLSILVVDDEAPARRRLQQILAKISDCSIAGEAVDGLDAQEKIRKLRPDVVLLDINMPGLDGLQIAAEYGTEQSNQKTPAIIFVTAHNEHAVQAFDLDATDYLLKPITRARLEKAIERVRNRQEESSGLNLPSFLPTTPEGIPRIAARHKNTLQIFDARQILCFQSQDKYTCFQVGGREFLMEKSLQQLESKLVAFDFFRVSRSELINLSAVVALHLESDGASLELASGRRVHVSRRRVSELKQRLGAV